LYAIPPAWVEGASPRPWARPGPGLTVSLIPVPLLHGRLNTTNQICGVVGAGAKRGGGQGSKKLSQSRSMPHSDSTASG